MNSNGRPKSRTQVVQQQSEDGFLDDLVDQVGDTTSATTQAAKTFYREWREFALRKSVFDVAVGLMIGSALTNISNSIVQDLISPLIFAWWTNGNLVNLFAVLKPGDTPNATYDTPAEAALDGAVTFNYGNFISACINFLIVTLTVFILFKILTRVKNGVEKLVD